MEEFNGTVDEKIKDIFNTEVLRGTFKLAFDTIELQKISIDEMKEEMTQIQAKHQEERDTTMQEISQLREACTMYRLKVKEVEETMISMGDSITDVKAKQDETPSIVQVEIPPTVDDEIESIVSEIVESVSIATDNEDNYDENSLESLAESSLVAESLENVSIEKDPSISSQQEPKVETPPPTPPPPSIDEVESVSLVTSLGEESSLGIETKALSLSIHLLEGCQSIVTSTSTLPPSVINLLPPGTTPIIQSLDDNSSLSSMERSSTKGESPISMSTQDFTEELEDEDISIASEFTREEEEDQFNDTNEENEEEHEVEQHEEEEESVNSRLERNKDSDFQPLSMDHEEEEEVVDEVVEEEVVVEKGSKDDIEDGEDTDLWRKQVERKLQELEFGLISSLKKGEKRGDSGKNKKMERSVKELTKKVSKMDQMANQNKKKLKRIETQLNSALLEKKEDDKSISSMCDSIEVSHDKLYHTLMKNVVHLLQEWNLISKVDETIDIDDGGKRNEGKDDDDVSELGEEDDEGLKKVDFFHDPSNQALLSLLLASHHHMYPTSPSSINGFIFINILIHFGNFLFLAVDQEMYESEMEASLISIDKIKKEMEDQGEEMEFVKAQLALERQTTTESALGEFLSFIYRLIEIFYIDKQKLVIAQQIEDLYKTKLNCKVHLKNQIQ